MIFERGAGEAGKTKMTLLGANAALLTDFYELTMLAGYMKEGRSRQRAVFEYNFRQLPRHTGFCICAGLEDFLTDLTNIRFDEEAIGWLRSRRAFDESFLEALKDFQFTGDVWAVPEGTPVFPNEPIIRVDGSIGEAQLVETLLLNRLNYQTLIATKAARVCFAAEGEPVLDFGLRRAQGPDGGLSGSRASYIGGCTGTSNVLAGKMYDIPVSGTMAHSWIMSYADERAAFRAYLDAFPNQPTLLLDTYDTEESGIPNAVEVFRERRAQGWRGKPAIRLDSGDLAYLSKVALEAFRRGGFDEVTIVASNELDEDLIADLKRQGAAINAWGVGTALMTGGGEPALGGVYKLVAIQENEAMVSKMKVSSNPGKTTDPGIKRPVRFFDGRGLALGDVLVDVEEEINGEQKLLSHDRIEYARVRAFSGSLAHEDLLQKVVSQGERTQAPLPLGQIREFAQKQLATLRPELRRLRNPERYWVGLSAHVADAKARAVHQLTSRS